MTHPQTTYFDPATASSVVKCVEPRETWYRYVNRETLDFKTDAMKAVVELDEYVVVRHTHKGVWLAQPPVWRWTKQKFVLNDSRKKYAYPNKADAWESFKIRKTRQYWILVHQRRHVGNVLRLIERDGQPT